MLKAGTSLRPCCCRRRSPRPRAPSALIQSTMNDHRPPRRRTQTQVDRQLPPRRAARPLQQHEERPLSSATPVRRASRRARQLERLRLPEVERSGGWTSKWSAEDRRRLGADEARFPTTSGAHPRGSPQSPPARRSRRQPIPLRRRRRPDNRVGADRGIAISSASSATSRRRGTPGPESSPRHVGAGHQPGAGAVFAARRGRCSLRRAREASSGSGARSGGSAPA